MARSRLCLWPISLAGHGWRALFGGRWRGAKPARVITRAPCVLRKTFWLVAVAPVGFVSVTRPATRTPSARTFPPSFFIFILFFSTLRRRHLYSCILRYYLRHLLYTQSIAILKILHGKLLRFDVLANR